MTTQPLAGRRVAVLGAGPIGLEAALHAATLGADVRVYERGSDVAVNVEAWGHVILFSPFGMNHTPLGRRLLSEHGVALPDDRAYMTGRQYRARYLVPLSQLPLLAGRIETGARALAVTRAGLLKDERIGEPARAEVPFRILLEGDGAEREETAGIVLDCTGSYGNANWMGPGGIPALGERALRDRIEYGLPDVLGGDRDRYTGRRVLLVGSGYSAATAALALARLACEAPGTSVVWATREGGPGPVPVIEGDVLPVRAALARDANRLAAKLPRGVSWCKETAVREVRALDRERFEVTLEGPDGVRREIFDRMIANVGYVPDSTIYRQLQVHECYATLAPMKLAAALLAASGPEKAADCLALGGFGPDVLKNPEPNFFILGMKSYGRNSAFLLRTGYEQVRDVFGILTGGSALPI